MLVCAALAVCVCCRLKWVAASGAGVCCCSYVCVVDARGSQQVVLVCAAVAVCVCVVDSRGSQQAVLVCAAVAVCVCVVDSRGSQQVVLVCAAVAVCVL